MLWKVRVYDKKGHMLEDKIFEDGGWDGDPSNMDVYAYVDQAVRKYSNVNIEIDVREL